MTKYDGETGCLVDGHHGNYAAIHVLNIAGAYGFVLSDEQAAEVDAYLDGQESYFLDQGGLLDQVEAWLNENIAEDGYAFGWHDGEFFYFSNEDWGSLID